MPRTDKQLLYTLAAAATEQKRKGNEQAAIVLWMARKYVKARLTVTK